MRSLGLSVLAAGWLASFAGGQAQTVADAYQLGMIALDSKDYARADQLLEQAEQREPGKTNALALRAKALIHLTRFIDAERCLRDYLGTHPESPDGTYLLAYVLFREGRPQESLAELTAAARQKRPSPDDLKIAGLDYVLLNDYSDAIKWLEQSVAGAPGDAEAAYYLGRAYYVQNSFDKAIAIFERALRIDPHHTKAECNLGLAYEATNETKAAEAAYREAIRLGNDSGRFSDEPYLDLADLLSRSSRGQEALALLDVAEQNGQSVRAETTRGRILFEQGRWPEAEVALRSASALKPDDGALHYLLGRVLKREGKANEAEKEFAQTRALESTHAGTPN